jgi:hypothetical protein
MATQVWKYPLKVEDKQWVELPRGAKILSVDVQNGTPCLWAQVDTEAVTDRILIVTHGTGHPMKSNNMQFIGTYQLEGGSFIGHVFKA